MDCIFDRWYYMCQNPFCNKRVGVHNNENRHDLSYCSWVHEVPNGNKWFSYMTRDKWFSYPTRRRLAMFPVLAVCSFMYVSFVHGPYTSVVRPFLFDFVASLVILHYLMEINCTYFPDPKPGDPYY